MKVINIAQDYGRRIKDLRQAMGLTQEAFAYEVGTTVATINKWENYRNKPSKMAIKLMGLIAKEKGLEFNLNV